MLTSKPVTCMSLVFTKIVLMWRGARCIDPEHGRNGMASWFLQLVNRLNDVPQSKRLWVTLLLAGVISGFFVVSIHLLNAMLAAGK